MRVGSPGSTFSLLSVLECRMEPVTQRPALEGSVYFKAEQEEGWLDWW